MAPSKSTDKKKTKKSSKSSGERKKDKERKSKDKDRKSSRQEKIDAAPGPVATPTVSPPTVHDPDAIQLFRRYDRNRSGVLTRLDFLQLLKDYADPASSGWGASISRPPLSLTDTSGIPLGYQRADRNSEFEAGQLFERYDRDHTGALTLDTFHVFFADFKPQLRAFVEESNYRALSPPAVTIVPEPLQSVQEEPVRVPPPTNVQEAATDAGDPLPSPKVIRAKYRSSLWKLRKICKDELFDQRELLVQKMKAIRKDMTTRQQNSSRNGKRRSRTSPFPDFDDDSYGENRGDNIPEKEETRQYEAMEDDLDRIDELIRYVRRYLNKGNDVSSREMQKLIEQTDGMEEEAQTLAMKEYGEIPQHIEPKKESEPLSHPSPPTSSSAPVVPTPLPSSHQKQTDLERLLRVKDQMIYQLLQERTALRKERGVVEANLKQLSDVSTREMKKWARLTDDMQAEIEQLRSQLRSQSQQRT